MASTFDRLGDILRDKLNGDADPFAEWDSSSSKPRQAGNTRERVPPKKRVHNELVPVPDELRADFAMLGVPAGTNVVECKRAWKRLLMTHHPDVNENSPHDKARSTSLSIDINNAWHRISRWYSTGSLAGC